MNTQKFIDTVLVTKFQTECFKVTGDENTQLVNAVREFTKYALQYQSDQNALNQINRSLDIAPDFVLAQFGIK